MISVIIPTSAESHRLPLLQRAIDSILSQEHVDTELVIVANGPRQDPEMLDRIRDENGACVLRLAEGHVAKARLAGLRESSGEYFCFLDDDDEFLPGGLKARQDAMSGNPETDIVVTDGLQLLDRELFVMRDGLLEAVRRSPGESYLMRNWFGSPCALFRRKSFADDVFDIPHRYFEWTYLLMRMVTLGKRFAVIDAVTYRKHDEVQASVSKSENYRLAEPAVLRDILRMPLDARLSAGIRRKLAAALSSASEIHRDRGEFGRAFGCYMLCLREGGWRHVGGIRALLLSALRRRPGHGAAP